MLQQLNFKTLHAAIRKKIEERTGLKCYDVPPLNAAPPFYLLEITGKDSDNTKTSYRTVYGVRVHAFSPYQSRSSIEPYNLIEKLEGALSEEVELPEPYTLYKQENAGVHMIEELETKERHAVTDWRFGVVWGYMVK